jgi:hypothetical protein
MGLREMSAEELRQKLMVRIDDLLSRTLLIRGEDRVLLTALRGYVSVMPASELTKVLTYVPKGEEAGPGQTTP